jgi:SAM-dependent methyltransferase
MKTGQLQTDISNAWEGIYSIYEPGVSPGIEYPTDTLVKHVSNLRKDDDLLNAYFDDKGQELSIKGNYTGNALEFGFGSIANLKMVRDKGFSCYGLEVSQETVSRGNEALIRENISDIKLQIWEPWRLPFEDRFFTLVYGLGCIYYNLELEKVIAEIHRIMENDATFLFSFFSEKHGYMEEIEHVSGMIYRWSDNHFNPRLRGIHLRFPRSKKEITQLFGAFRDVNVFTWETEQLPCFQSFWFVRGKK